MNFQKKHTFYRRESLTNTSSGKFVKSYIHRVNPKFEILPPSKEKLLK